MRIIVRTLQYGLDLKILLWKSSTVWNIFDLIPSQLIIKDLDGESIQIQTSPEGEIDMSDFRHSKVQLQNQDTSNVELVFTNNEGGKNNPFWFLEFDQLDQISMIVTSRHAQGTILGEKRWIRSVAEILRGDTYMTYLLEDRTRTRTYFWVKHPLLSGLGLGTAHFHMEPTIHGDHLLIRKRTESV